MRLFHLFALAGCFAPGLFVSSAGIPHPERNQLAGLAARETAPTSSTATETFTDTTGASRPDALPIQPTVTPALGFGGFILIVAGLVLALIGIRNLRVQVFLSVAFLTSLGVIVLIVYVMSPPVRVAVQGAYLVAVFFSGITFGAVALVFKELTEGLGCLLGGFCTSMWLLSLKPGGLLTDTDSKSGFIGAISLVFYALSFSHHTRPYGLIVSTGISGGTAVALGIDCFSRAGLKEFWLYIWALNNDIFPLGTKNYPITRNIRVELAATVIIAIMGVVSQLRLWKVVRERRRKEKEKREEEQRKKEEAEAEVGRRIAEQNMQERKEWEAKYGVRDPPSDVSELADDAKCHADEMDAMEKGDACDMKSIASSSEGSYRCSDCREREANGDADSDATGGAEGGCERDQDGTIKERTGHTPEECGAMPLKVFDGADATRIKDDKASDMTAVIGSETATIRSKRFSGASFMKRLSRRSSGLPLSQSQEALVSVDDASSSVDGTTDEGRDLASDCHTVQGDNHERTNEVPKEGELQPAAVSQGKQASTADELKGETTQIGDGQAPAEPETSEAKADVKPEPHNASPEAASITATPAAGEDPVLAGEQKMDKGKATIPVTQDDEKSQSPEASEKPAADELKDSKHDQPQSDDSDRKISNSDGQDDQPPDEANPPQALSQDEKVKPSRSQNKLDPKPPKEEPTKEPPKLDEETVKHLPRRTSKVVQSYRTNEWAKHLADAEAPQLEPILPIEEEQPEYPREVEEAAVPVNVEELLQTPLNAQPPPAVEPRERDPPSRRTSHRISSGGESPGSGDRLKKKSSNSPPPTAQPRLSTAFTIAPDLPGEDPGSDPPKPQWRGPPPLIAVREDMVRNRLSSYSLTLDPYSRSSPGHHSSSSPTPTQTPHPPDEADDMPLSQRRALLYQQKLHPHPQPQPRHPPTSPNSPPQPPPHPFRALPTNTPAAMAAWRESIHEDLKDKRNPLSPKQHTHQTPAAARGSPPPPYSPSLRNVSGGGGGNPTGITETQRGNMSELHREAMRRMQAQANKNVNGF
ncbi:hypothetical protein BO70DRAFT_320171 [Aspergillus heteromorphus CBS 117.55]|uniref:TM7S3/TM198-like domain-containing protein n=1 Tax=Aspergillus heteromorphus CBS 117.55 TaxID=1448321 RepID=A0A317VHH5_9EURO|nr:uncharacterized protein BO70DRAFT_320171 [Aspergillus heteromorphus CBS 117.55]PWY72899.1 hypothetical protein BO70DRAFT_320171 [Aspergillus heteromorphus CBS 117.55]